MEEVEKWLFDDLSDPPVPYCLEKRGSTLTLTRDGVVLSLESLPPEILNRYEPKRLKEIFESNVRRVLEVILANWPKCTRKYIRESIWPDDERAEENLKHYLAVLRRLFGNLIVSDQGLVEFRSVVRYIPPQKSQREPPLVTLSDLRGFEPVGRDEILPLLDPRRCGIRFIGRDIESKALWEWINEETTVSFRALVGHGGSGKTRLAIHLLELLEEHYPGRWHAGFSRPNWYENITWDRSRPTLIVVDDASACAELIAKQIIPAVYPPRQNIPFLRFLLIDRGADENKGWFHQLRTAAGLNPRLFPNSPIRLRGLGHPADLESSERSEFLELALRRLSDHTGRPAPIVDTASKARLRELDDPLILFMAAIVSHERGDLLPLTWRRVDLADHIAAHEWDRVSKIASNAFLPLHMAAYVTLCGGLGLDELRAACREECALLDTNSQWRSDDLAMLIERKVLPSESTALAAEPIVPDVVGEVFTERVLQDPYHTAPQCILRAFKRKPGPVVRTLVHMLYDFSDKPERQAPVMRWLDDLLQVDIEGARSHLAAALASEADLQSSLLRRGQTLELVGKAVALYRTVARTNDEYKYPLALALYKLSLLQIGHEKHNSLESAREAASLYAELAPHNPHLTWVWGGLRMIMATLQWELGDEAAALETERETGRLRTILPNVYDNMTTRDVSQGFPVYRVDPSAPPANPIYKENSVHTYVEMEFTDTNQDDSTWRSAVRDRLMSERFYFDFCHTRVAIEFIDKALVRCRSLVEQGNVQFLPHLGKWFKHKVMILIDAERIEEALTANAEAMRWCANTSEGEFEEMLVRHALISTLVHGVKEAPIDNIHGLVTRAARLAEQNQLQFSPLLADVLERRMQIELEQEKLPAALDTINQVVRLRREILVTDPKSRRALAKSLGLRAGAQIITERSYEAITSIVEATELLADLVVKWGADLSRPLYELMSQQMLVLSPSFRWSKRRFKRCPVKIRPPMHLTPKDNEHILRLLALQVKNLHALAETEHRQYWIYPVASQWCQIACLIYLGKNRRARKLLPRM